MRAGCVAISFALGGCLVGDTAEFNSEGRPGGDPDATGFGDTYFATGSLDTSNPFFTSLGTNGRSCGSCHLQDQGWTITPDAVRARFDQTDGMDPIFRTNDGSVSPNADVSTSSARRVAYDMLIRRGLIRVGIGIPAAAEFSLVAVDDPYHFASAAQLSLFRRPLPSTNLDFLPTVMWDGRETFNTADINGNLTHQANDATLGHAQATGTDSTQMAAIVSFETSIYTAQSSDNVAGKLDNPAAGGPTNIAALPFFVGINDPLGGNPTGVGFTPRAFTLFDKFSTPGQSAKAQRQNSIYRGQEIFNTRPVTITGVRGLNDKLGMPSITGTCTTCHDTPNVGNHSVSLPLDLGLTDESRRTSDMPLYTLQNNSTGAIIKTTDPGRALITGKWADVARFKGPILRGLSMRAPYFHNGFAASLDEVVNFYNGRFNLNLSAQEQTDLIAFLSSL
jgi:cytochrome c peroxidase